MSVGFFAHTGTERPTCSKLVCKSVTRGHYMFSLGGNVEIPQGSEGLESHQQTA